jgi:hypothetical protein
VLKNGRTPKDRKTVPRRYDGIGEAAVVAYFCLSKTLAGSLGLASTGMNKEDESMDPDGCREDSLFAWLIKEYKHQPWLGSVDFKARLGKGRGVKAR